MKKRQSDPLAYQRALAEDLLRVICDPKLPRSVYDFFQDAATEALNLAGISDEYWDEENDCGIFDDDAEAMVRACLVDALVHEARLEQAGEKLVGAPPRVLRIVSLRRGVWEALSKDAERCTRTPRQQLAAILGAYYKLVGDDEEGSIPAVTVGLLPSLE